MEENKIIFKEELIKQFKKGTKSIKVKGLIGPRSKVSLAIHSLTGNNLTLETSSRDIKVRFQPQHYNDGKWNNNPYRLDNSHINLGEPLHVHWFNDVNYPDHITSLREIFKGILGSEFKEEDFI